MSRRTGGGTSARPAREGERWATGSCVLTRSRAEPGRSPREEGTRRDKMRSRDASVARRGRESPCARACDVGRDREGSRGRGGGRGSRGEGGVRRRGVQSAHLGVRGGGGVEDALGTAPDLMAARGDVGRISGLSDVRTIRGEHRRAGGLGLGARRAIARRVLLPNCVAQSRGGRGRARAARALRAWDRRALRVESRVWRTPSGPDVQDWGRAAAGRSNAP